MGNAWKAIALLTLGILPAGAVSAESSLEDLARQAASPNGTVAQSAIAALRDRGPDAVQTFWETYRRELPTHPRMRSVLDKICKQRDCDTSRLYWYTDLEAAKRMARKQNKPILSLRLLGNLDEELSCANSRFFRTVLYPNREVSQLLRDRFVLHWQSVRPVPKITIDFGDGRKLDRTLTGNSIHYILDPNGLPVDALPGLYGAKAFQQQLQVSESAAREAGQMQGLVRTTFLGQYHRDRLVSLQERWTADLTRANLSPRPLLSGTLLPQSTEPVPNAEVAGVRAYSKAVLETPILRSSALRAGSRTFASLEDTDWAKLASLYREAARLDDGSKSFMQRKSPDGFQTMLPNFEEAIAQDTVRNEYLLHARIHQWFTNWKGTENLQALNERVYSELFLTPSSDPWLGLVSPDVYTGIDSRY